MARLRGAVPAALARAERLPERAAAASPLALTVVLNRTDQQGFEAFLRDVQNPQSPAYRRYLSPREQADRFGPSPQAYREVSAWLRSKGFSFSEGSANRLTLTVRGTRKRAEEAFGIQIADYRSGDRTFYANDRDPALPAELAPHVQAVIGLSNLARPASSIQKEVKMDVCFLVSRFAENWDPDYKQCLATHNNSAMACEGVLHRARGNLYANCIKDPPKKGNGAGNGPSGSGASGSGGALAGLSLTPRSSQPYEPQAATAARWVDVDGAGQKIGLLEFDTFNLSDMRDYFDLIGSPPERINQLTQVHVNGGAQLGAEEAEVLMDIVAVMTNAPGAQVAVYDAPFSGIRTSFQTLFNRMIGDGVTVISNSWVYCEDQATLADAQSLDSVLASAAAAGITVLNSTGDLGSACVNGSANTASLPASAPHATAVGGTSLDVGPALTYDAESFWNGLSQTPPTGAGGFGVSRFFTRPAYQNGFTSSPTRSVPDVSLNADPAKGIDICWANGGGCPTGGLYGGTSLAAPLWAAYVALLNQAQGQNLGELNPRLYPLGATAAFHTPASMGTDFQHVGLGSPNLNLIHRALAGKAVGPISPSVSEVTAAPNGGVADGNSEAFVVVRLRDADGNSVSGKTVTLAASAGAHATVAPASGVSNVANGAVVFSIKDTVPEIVTFTATDATDGVALQPQARVAFIERPAAAGGITAAPATVSANGADTVTITVTLQDANGNPSPNKQVILSQGNGSSIISGTTATTDATGKVSFTAVSVRAETVTYTAVDATDGNLPVPGSATVSFVNASGFCASFGRYGIGQPAPGFAVSTFASSFPNDCFTNIGPIGLAFDANGTLLVGDAQNNNLYAFGQQGGVAGPATLVGTVPAQFGLSLAGLAFTRDGRLYAVLANGNNLVELNPTTAAVVRTVAHFSGGSRFALAVDPVSGDLFVSGFDGIIRVSNFAAGPGTITPYTSGDFDGIAFATDGTLYAAAELQGGIHRIAGTNAPQPGAATLIAILPGNPDGIAFEPNPAHPAKPFLYVNRNDGTITRIDTSALPDTPVTPCAAGCTDIYTSGSRGDFVTVGPTGCLYATQSERVIRLTNADGTCSLTPADVVPRLALTPENVQPSPAQGTTVTFTAQLKNVADPANVPVTLLVGGANPAPLLARTDAQGRATFTYTGQAVGTDQAVATVELDSTPIFSNESKVTWTPGRHRTFVTLNLSPAGGVPDRPLALAATLVDTSTEPATAVSGVSLTFTLAGQTCSATTDAAGTARCSLTPNAAAGAYTLAVAFAGTSALVPAADSKRVTLIDAPLPTVQFGSAAAQVGEGAGRVTLTVTRAGDTTAAVSVDYRTADTDTFTVGCFDTTNNHGGAYARCDFATVVGTLSFAEGETSKTVTVPVIDDGYAEGPETFQLVLSNPTGATLGTPEAATVTIADNDPPGGAPNPIFVSDFFVRQHYLDFLSREPEPEGLAAWLRVLNGCPNVNNTNPPPDPSAGCDRLTVSAAFFGSQEFQLKGFYVFRFYKLAYNRLPEYLEIIPDMSFVAGATAEEVFARKAQLAVLFTQRPEFQAAYGGLPNSDYVQALMGRAGLTQVTTPDPANPDGATKVTLTSVELTNRLNSNTLTRAQVFRAIADSDQVGAAEFNNAFVAMQYYGYLRRKPEPTGFNAWLQVLRSGDIRTMVNGFLNSAEYRLRFGRTSQ
ncbi:MAG TPA: protease pro-enzyme activation domain-containing protein [Pyrinomonadaceae bacterium]